MNAHVRLAGLWLSQVDRILADSVLRMFVVLQVAGAKLRGQEGWTAIDESAWHQVTVFYIAPFILLAPFNGAICNSLPRRWVLVGSALFCAVATALFLMGGPWLWCMAVVALGAAVYSPARYAVLPAAAAETRIPLPRVNAWIELGGSVALVGGLLLGWYLNSLQEGGIYVAVGLAALLNFAGTAAALPVWFAADVRRSESAVQAVAGFFRDCWRILRDPSSRGSLLGLAGFLALITAGSGAVFMYILRPDFAARRGGIPLALIATMLGAAIGSGLAGLQGNLRRGLGLVPFSLIGLLGALAWAALSTDYVWPCLALGLLGGLANTPLRAAYQAAVPADARGNAMAVMNTAIYVAGVGLAAVLVGFVRADVLNAAGQLWFLAILAVAGALIACWVLRNQTLELLLEFVIWPMYRVRAMGPGVGRIPLRGPLLVVANHTAYVDPFWIGKIMPRRVIPMMTSVFYDKPVINFLMRRLVQAIRVEQSDYRREAPELKEAIADLDRGLCVIVFPEGRLRRKEERVLRQFGQGIWHILKERPETPVVVCWIEGGWGSYASYYNGPPMKNKRLDWWRPIRIGVNEPIVVDKTTLADHRSTREYLMRMCLSARRHLGLQPIALENLSGEEPVPAASDQTSAE